MSLLRQFLSSPTLVFSAGFLLRAILLVYGIYQDSVSAFKYTDIDYYVFTDASREVSRDLSPYNRATYRYTPLLAWILLPTAWGGLWFHTGKALFAISDLVAGWLIWVVLRRKGIDKTKALEYAAVWLLNPMVANISTRGSSEGLLCVLVIALLWAYETDKIVLSGALLGFGVHFKIYPFIYGPSLIWAMKTPPPESKDDGIFAWVRRFITPDRVKLVAISLTVFMGLNLWMYRVYGMPFLQHTFFHHLTRIDHRHNFSPYSTLLYQSSALSVTDFFGMSRATSFESLAFVPQLLLSAVLIPITTSKIDLPSTMMAQTLAFVTFNKVCTSQYFLWYLIFLPLYLPGSRLTRYPKLGLVALGLWALGQVFWLQQGFQLEFLGKSTFVPGLWASTTIFFIINCWILGIVVQDLVTRQDSPHTKPIGQRVQSPTTNNKTPGKPHKNGSINKMGTVHLGPRGHTLKSN